ncbi:MAG: N-acetylglucosamine kinase [Cyclobacteriaceae bacterium]|nr:N-acetylglucosamine kinase [Cyclobacteriaceae bacterium]
MKIIADSGASKTAWSVIQNNGEVKVYETMGLNPYNVSERQIDLELKNGFLKDFRDVESRIYFYGAGCSSIGNVRLLTRMLQDVLPKANIKVEDDMLGAARATCSHSEGIVGILGTGSNSCYYDGEKIAGNITSLGFILGDEGSGAHMGKILMADFVRKEMPQNIYDKLKNEFNLTRDNILNKVYREERPNRFLASFGRFILANMNESYIAKLVFSSFEEFFKNTIMRYPRYQEMDIHFVGSVAYHFEKYLRQAALPNEIKIKNIFENPISGLTLYHSNGD